MADPVREYSRRLRWGGLAALIDPSDGQLLAYLAGVTLPDWGRGCHYDAPPLRIAPAILTGVRQYLAGHTPAKG